MSRPEDTAKKYCNCSIGPKDDNRLHQFSCGSHFVPIILKIKTVQCFFTDYHPLVQCYNRYVFWPIDGLKRVSYNVIVYLCYTKNEVWEKNGHTYGSYVTFPVESTGIISFPVTRIFLTNCLNNRKFQCLFTDYHPFIQCYNRNLHFCAMYFGLSIGEAGFMPCKYSLSRGAVAARRQVLKKNLILIYVIQECN